MNVRRTHTTAGQGGYAHGTLAVGECEEDGRQTAALAKITTPLHVPLDVVVDIILDHN